MRGNRMTRSLVLICLAVALVSSCNRNPEAAALSYVQTGNKFYKNNKARQARIMYLRALNKDKRCGPAYYRLGVVEAELGNPIGSLRSLQRAVELLPPGTPDSLDANARLADLLLAVYQYEPTHSRQWLKDMEELSTKLLAKDPKNFQGLRIRALAHLTREGKPDLEAAIADLKAANSVNPDRPEVVNLLIQVLVMNNQFEEAEKLGRDTIAKNKQATATYDLLYAMYNRQAQTHESEAKQYYAQAEGILKLQISNNPTSIDLPLRMAFHYLAFEHDRAKADAAVNKVMVDFKDNPDMRLKVGGFYHLVRDYQLAYDQYALGAKEQPKRAVEFQRYMVETLVSLNRRQDALNLVENILKDAPKDDPALAMRAALLLQAGGKENIERAVVEMQGLVSRMQDNPVLRFNYGRALLTRNHPGDIDQAAVQFDEAVKLRPSYVPARLARAEVAFNKGDFPKAQVECETVLKQPDGAQNPLAHLIRARALYAQGNKGEARTELNQVLKMNPNLLDAQFQLALLDLTEKNYKAADEVFERLYKQTGDTRSLFSLADSLVAQKRTDEALRMLKSEIDKNPKRGDLRLALGNAAALSGNLKMASDEFEKVVELYPTSGDAYMRLAEVYRMMSQNDKAVANFRKAVQFLPNDFRPSLQLGVILDVSGDKKGARGLYEQVLKMRPDQEVALNNLAFMLAEEGSDLDRALGMAERARQRAPEAWDIADTLGWIYLKKNLSDQALNVFQEIVKKNPENPIYRYHLALALFQKGDRVQAKKEATLALQKKPTKDDENKIRELISKAG